MEEKINYILEKLNKVNSNSINYINIISQCEHEIEAVIYGNEKNKKIELIKLLNNKNIILNGIENNLEQRKFLIKAIIFALENIKYLYSIQIETLNPKIILKIKVKNYDEILSISENMVFKFRDLINREENFISINNLEDRIILENLKEYFKNKENKSNITQKIFNENYQLNISSPLSSHQEIKDIKSYSIYITSIQNK